MICLSQKLTQYVVIRKPNITYNPYLFYIFPILDDSIDHDAEVCKKAQDNKHLQNDKTICNNDK